MGRRVYAYIDGFNFYYGTIKQFPKYKWLDLFKFCQLLMAGDNLLKVKYFTALVNGNSDKRKPVRQTVYWQALKAMYPDKIEIIKGHFRVDPKIYRIAEHQNSTSKNCATNNSIYIMKPEEKGTDVNLAVHLVHDACEDDFDIGLVVSNDSDLAEAIRITKESCGKAIALANPFQWKQSGAAKKLRDLQIESRNIRTHQLSQSILPQQIPGTNITIPSEWVL